MKEDFLHYVWAQELYKREGKATSGEEIRIISPGTKNSDSGPDFHNARIEIDGTIWAGNVEIHTDSAHWTQHNHHHDKAYDNVILHVVNRATQQTYRTNGGLIPTLELDFDNRVYDNYQKLAISHDKIACAQEIEMVDRFVLSMWLNSLAIERLEEKSSGIAHILSHTNNNWEETFYIILARNFGFNTNSLPFELLAKSIPLSVLSKIRNDQDKLEALLMGQAGFLSKDNPGQPYYQKLQNEYMHLQKAYKLTPLQKHIWKFSKLRPSNFPTIRISQFANLIGKSHGLFSKTLDINTSEDIIRLYTCEASPFWKTHYTFEKTSKDKTKKMGKTAILGILINTVIPFMFYFGKERNKPELQEKALFLLENIPREKNNITNQWTAIGLDIENAMHSQALIQLTRNYCLNKNCLYCQIGNEIIRENTK